MRGPKGGGEYCRVILSKTECRVDVLTVELMLLWVICVDLNVFALSSQSWRRRGGNWLRTARPSRQDLGSLMLRMTGRSTCRQYGQGKRH